MNKTVIINNQTIQYELRRLVRSRGLRLTIKSSGQIIVVAPKFVPEKFIEAFIFHKQDWLLKKLTHFSNAQKKFPPIKLTPEKIATLKKTTLKRIVPKLEKYSQLLDVKYKKVSVKNQTSRWGSCSRVGNLNFNCRLALLPDEVIDYVVVHELCHIRHFNHSPKFWSLVASLLPEYKQQKKILRDHVMALS